MIAGASRGFLFFSHFFWLAWVPFSVCWLEREPWRRRMLLSLTGLGTIFGLSVFLPSFLRADWLSVELVQSSLEYKTVFIYDDFVNRTVLRGFHALIVLSALFLSTDQRIRLFGGLIAASLLFAYLFFAHALVSVWCVFAAVLSTYIVTILAMERRQALATAKEADLSMLRYGIYRTEFGTRPFTLAGCFLALIVFRAASGAAESRTAEMEPVARPAMSVARTVTAPVIAVPMALRTGRMSETS
jgi:hypothetical protein